MDAGLPNSHAGALRSFFCVGGFEDHESRRAVSCSVNGRSEVARDNKQVGLGGTGLKGEE
jgi:hypothetical protein